VKEWIEANEAKSSGNLEPLKQFIQKRKAQTWQDEVVSNLPDITTADYSKSEYLEGQKIDGEFIWSEIEVAEKLEDEFSEGTNMNNLASIFLKDRLRICDSYEFVDGAPIREDELEAELNELEYQFQKDVLQEYWKLLQLEYEYLFSDEFLADHFDNMEYQFTENGVFYNF
jgi:hypothetical protein